MTAVADALRARRVQRGWWLVYVGLVAADLLLIPTSIPTNIEGFLSYVLTYLTPMLLALGMSAWISFRVEGVERRFWGLLAAASACFIVAEGYWTYYETWIDPRGPHIPNWFELGHLAGFTLFFVMLVSMTELGEAPMVTKTRVYLDIVGGSIVLFTVIYWFWTLPLFLPLSYGGWEVAIVAAMFPVAGVLILLAMGVLVVGRKAYRWRIWERLVVGVFAMFGIGVISFPVMYSGWIAAPVPHRFAPDTLVYGLGFYLIFMAGIYRTTSDEEGARARRWAIPEMSPPWLPMLYPSLLALALPVMGIAAMRQAETPGGMVLVATTVMLALMLIVRSWLSSIELAHHRTRSITDPTTGSFNQRHLYDRLPIELAEAELAQSPLAAVAFDVVDFRNIERMLGSPEGDRVLRELVDILRAESSSGSNIYRVGGDEFVLTVPGMGGPQALALAHKVNALVANTVAVDSAPVMLSAGVSVFPGDGVDAETLIARALASQQLARSAERTDVVAFDAEVVDAADSLARLERARRQSHRAKLRSLAGAVDARDEMTRFHSEVVGEIASAFALVLDLSDDETRLLETAALVHDIGKVGVPDEILLKVGPLTEDEFTVLRDHPVLGEKLLRPADMPEVLPAVRHHHERWDGTGYPDGLIGDEIPFEARVLALCDAFEAMTHPRHYREAVSTESALAEIVRCSGTQFDPALAEAFGSMVVRMHGRAVVKRAATARSDYSVVLEPELPEA